MNFTTNPVIIRGGASSLAHEFISENFGGRRNIIAVCDENTERFAADVFPGAERFIFPGNISADPTVTTSLEERAAGKNALLAVGSGTVHDLTRYTAHKIGIPFVSYPTAPSVDGFVSGIAAMTVDGQKLSFPASPPCALFAEPDVFMTAPASLTAAGVGDLLGKYISLFDWQISNLVTGERWDDEIAALERGALDKLVSAEPGGPDFGVLLMEALVASGLAIQAYGSSRPASGSEHHLSHLWEMHCINAPTAALHGEKVGVSTLLLLERYRGLENFTLRENIYERGYLETAFGSLADGILRENLPDPLAGMTQTRLDSLRPALREAADALPEPRTVKMYMDACSCKTGVESLGLPGTPEFLRRTLDYAPYVRRRVTMLKLCVIC